MAQISDTEPFADRRTYHLIDPELRPALAELGGFELSAALLPELKRQLEAAVPGLDDICFEQVSVQRVEVATPDGHVVALYIYRPISDVCASRPLYFHMHGGGYVLGHPLLNAADCARISGELGCIVASVDYRLAPTAHALGQVEDCYHALIWMIRNATECGFDTSRIALGGESAGGGLAAALAIYLRDHSDVKPCLQLLVAPMLDDQTGKGTQTSSVAGEFVWNAQANRIGWGARLDGLEPEMLRSHHAVPARLAHASSLPPAFIGVGALDLFLEENLEYAKLLIAGGVAVEAHVYPGAFHGFEFARDAGVSKRAMMDRDNALRVAFRTAR